MKSYFLNTFKLGVLFLGLITCGSDDDPTTAPPPPTTTTTTTETVPSNFQIYVSDAGKPWRIYKYDGNGSSAQVFIKDLGWPQDIVFLEDKQVVLVSNLDVAFSNISRFNAATGAFIDHFATGIGGPTRMKIGKDNLLYVLQWVGDGTVLRYKLDGTFVDKFTKIGVSQSIGLDWDSSGNLYVSSYNNNGLGGYVRKFDSQGNDMGVYIPGLNGPTNIWFDGAGNLMVLEYNGGAVKRYDATGKFLGIVISGLNQPEGVAILDEGHILIGNGGTGSVKVYNKDFKFIKDIVPSGAGGLVRPNAVIIRKTQ
jgi:hypothetical protein